SVAFSKDGSRAFVPIVRVRNLLPIVQVDRGWVMSTVLASIDVATGRVALLPLNESCDALPDPSAVAIGADGARALVASATTDRCGEVRIADALAMEDVARPETPERVSWTARYAGRMVDVGAGPAGLATAGNLVAVAERLDDSVALFDGDGRLVARIAVVPH